MKNSTDQTGEQFEALQNAIDNCQIKGLKLHLKEYNDKRKTTPKFFLSLETGQTISPSLDYVRMNHFILGMNTGVKLSKLNR